MSGDPRFSKNPPQVSPFQLLKVLWGQAKEVSHLSYGQGGSREQVTSSRTPRFSNRECSLFPNECPVFSPGSQPCSHKGTEQGGAQIGQGNPWGWGVKDSRPRQSRPGTIALSQGTLTQHDGIHSSSRTELDHDLQKTPGEAMMSRGAPPMKWQTRRAQSQPRGPGRTSQCPVPSLASLSSSYCPRTCQSAHPHKSGPNPHRRL